MQCQHKADKLGHGLWGRRGWVGNETQELALVWKLYDCDYFLGRHVSDKTLQAEACNGQPFSFSIDCLLGNKRCREHLQQTGRRQTVLWKYYVSSKVQTLIRGLFGDFR